MSIAPSKVAINQLPDLPSALIRVALKDLALVERSKKYTIDMTEWHDSMAADGFDTPEACSVCFAGAVMAKTLDANIEWSILPSHYKTTIEKKLLSLDMFREGNLRGGIKGFNSEVKKKFDDLSIVSKEPSDVEVEDYNLDPKQFRKDMWKIVYAFEKVGL